MSRTHSLNSELFLSNWTAEALDSSVKRWMECKSKQSSAGVYVISDENWNFLKIDFEDPIKQDDVLKINQVPFSLATVFKNFESVNAVKSFLEAVGIKNLEGLQIWNLKTENGIRLN